MNIIFITFLYNTKCVKYFYNLNNYKIFIIVYYQSGAGAARGPCFLSGPLFRFCGLQCQRIWALNSVQFTSIIVRTWPNCDLIVVSEALFYIYIYLSRQFTVAGWPIKLCQKHYYIYIYIYIISFFYVNLIN